MNISAFKFTPVAKYQQLHKSKKVVMRNFLLSMLAYHVAIFIGYLSVWLGVSRYSTADFSYLLLLIYVTSISITYWHLKPAQISRTYSNKIMSIQAVNWFLIFALWSFLMVDMRATSLVCAMMAMAFLFANSSFSYSLLLSFLVASLYLLIGYIGGHYFAHPWSVSDDIINASAFFLSAVLIGYMVHATTVLLRQQAYNDFLTKLLNRRAMSNFIEAEFQRSLRFNTPATLVMMDLDNFKVINDRFGHGGGDAVLVHVADELKQHLRGTDHLARWGGEEFLALLIGVSPERAQFVVERALMQLHNKPLSYKENSIKVSFSAGISALNDFDSAEAAIQEADRMLYVAKKAGKSRVMLSTKLALSVNQA